MLEENAIKSLNLVTTLKIIKVIKKPVQFTKRRDSRRVVLMAVVRLRK